MRAAHLLHINIALICLTTACGPDTPDAQAPTRVIEGGEGVCAGGVRRPRVEVFAEVAPLGELSNHIARFGDDVWVVQSGENTIGRLRTVAGGAGEAYVRDALDVGNDQNPYDVWVEDGRAYVTGSLGQTLTVLDAATGEVLKRVTSPDFDNPSGVTVTARAVYVTSYMYDPLTNDFGEGRITVLSRETLEVIGSLPARWPNPQYATRVQTPDGERVIIVSTGGVVVRDGEAVLTSDAGVEVWRETADLLAPEREPYALPRAQASRPGIGAPGRALPAADGATLYLTSATSPALFKLDLTNKRWRHGVEDPLIVYETTSANALHHAALDARGVLHLTSFNQDALYLWDTTCDRLLAGPIALDVAPTLLEGPHGIALTPDPAGGSPPEAHYIMSRGNVLGRLRYGW